MQRGAVLLALVLAASGQVDVQFPGGSVNVRKGLGGTMVDVQHPAGSVNVNKGLGGTGVDVQHPAGSVNVGKASSSSSSLAGSRAGAQPDLLSMVLRALLGLGANGQQRAAGSATAFESASVGGRKDVDVAYPGGAVSVRKAPAGNKVVDVAYPGGSVNVGNNGNNVDVAFPGGFVKLDPKEPGKRRNGVVVFPFGSVRFG